MNEVSPARRQTLRRVANEVSAPLDEAGLDRLLGYLDLLQRWNATYNLTALRDPEQMLVQHLFDCLAVIQPLRRELPPLDCRLLDVGSGGGLPGVVIAALCPAWTVVCVDAVGKKAAFVRQAAAELKLPNLHAEHARVEALKATPFDAIVSRAFASLPDFVRLTRSLLKPDGLWVAMKGKTPNEEMAALPPDVDVFHVEQLSVPELKADRCLVWLRQRN
ncbi:16S rRNA (guanine(527)-N(7))-methyltransferase RsmG [Piscinibacter sp.]|uniref:16S rRNA (guanine(527)-N(7))-methyltransferase RsmG n=1 Tax=Piscinibacter sp. TaxID=1903157 RepID=UPI002CEF7FE6|nr:16S rRNA (guanine(527)-N(7))-methyltransferase RsmG [Albitalea sp.]HUG25554.1 16S rRNA (guanine(527)-N(7))-methyltransferase RsmG [Albitalea sp.]